MCKVESDSQRKHLVDIWEVHLRAMLILVHTLVHNFEAPFLLYLLHQSSVYGKVTNRRSVLAAPSGCSARQVVVV